MDKESRQLIDTLISSVREKRDGGEKRPPSGNQQASTELANDRAIRLDSQKRRPDQQVFDRPGTDASQLQTPSAEQGMAEQNKKADVPSTIQKKPVRPSKPFPKKDGQQREKQHLTTSKGNRKLRRHKSLALAAMVGSFVLVMLVLIVGAVLVGMKLSAGVIQGTSMEPTLHEADHILYYKTQDVQRFDVIVLRSEDGKEEEFVKRVVGIPGDRIDYSDGYLMVNQRVVIEDYLRQTDANMQSIRQENTFEFADIIRRTKQFSGTDETAIAAIAAIPEDMYLVLGDNRNNSYDSRDFGLVKKESIKGIIKIRFSSLFDSHYFKTDKNDVVAP